MKCNKVLNPIFICNSLICILFFFLYLFCCKDMIIQLDPLRDAFAPFFSYADHGNYVVQAIIRLITFTIPYHIGIHPMDFAATYGIVFRATVLVFFGYFLSFAALKETTIKYLKPILLLLFQLSIMTTLFRSGFWQVECANGFGRFIIAQLFLILFWTYFVKFYNKDIQPTRKQMVFLCLFALIAGNIQELIAFSSAFSLFFLIVIDLIKNKKTNRYLVLSLAFVILGGLLMYFNPNYTLAAKSHSGDITFQSIMLGLKDWKNFFSLYFDTVIKRHLVIHLFILLTIFIGFVKGTRKELVPPSFLYAGLFTFFLTFIIAKGDITNYLDFLEGDTNYPNFWLTHHDFPTIIRLYLLFVWAMFLNVPLKRMQNNLKDIICMFFIVIIPILFHILIMPRYALEAIKDGVFSDLSERKKECYEIDSMTLHYTTRKEPVILFKPRRSYSIFIDYPNYLEKVYAIELGIDDITWIDKEIALEKFLESGGKFSEDEFKNIKFASLFEKYNLKFDNKRPVKLEGWVKELDNEPRFNVRLRIKNKFLELIDKTN